MAAAANREPLSPPAFEAERQRAVDSSGLLRGWAASDLQRIVERAAKIFKAPIAAISIIDQQRQWFAAGQGFGTDETPRSQSFCAHAIHRPGEPMVVTDAAKDPRFSDNPLVTDNPGIRFYAGVPLVDRMGYALGALCIVDTKPRDEPENLIELTLLAHEAERALKR
ncbi:GAF domain-containing protein [Sphingomonas sp. BIUV-7]|uniref:GAF domain-containing protein n=1 Tax=Sphingomonas natans TaxID=3063330 RepID=A0ABT8Y8T2_9SPHN|nr:GAF domain-containing protein [Sphingomonas sp. BIUV-7]MDO6414738.1 GAF domain-containing protein [Sphingomonas sp. BIUV-7]